MVRASSGTLSASLDSVTQTSSKQFRQKPSPCTCFESRKIDILRRIPNLRRIAVAPSADVRSCAEQIGDKYVMSYRPNPALMVCCGWDAERVRKVVTEALELARANSCHVDITLKDVTTVEHDASRLPLWTRIVRNIADEFS